MTTIGIYSPIEFRVAARWLFQFM